MKQLNNKKKKKIRRKGFLFIAVGAVLITLASFVYVLLVSFLTGAVIEARHGDEVAYALMNIVTPSYGYVSLFFIAILAIWAFVPTEEELKKQNQGLSPMLGQKQSEGLSKRSLWLITGGLVAAVVVTGAISINTYKLITPDGIRNYFFVETKSYEWKQVTGYTIDCENENDGLSVTFTMRDGKQIEILQGVNSTTEKFDEQYTSVTHFAYDLDQRMVELQVPRNARHVERAAKLYKDTTLWPYVQKLIGYAELVPEPDETSPETESDSLPASETADPTN